MNTFYPNIARDSNTVVRGKLYWSDDVEDLGQDMLEVKFTSGHLLCAGWVPEEDPSGAYQITVRLGLKLISRFRTTSFNEAQSHIQELVWSLGAPATSVASSFATGEYSEYRYDSGPLELSLA